MFLHSEQSSDRFTFLDSAFNTAFNLAHLQWNSWPFIFNKNFITIQCAVLANGYTVDLMPDSVNLFNINTSLVTHMLGGEYVTPTVIWAMSLHHFLWWPGWWLQVILMRSWPVTSRGFNFPTRGKGVCGCESPPGACPHHHMLLRLT